MTVFLLKSLAHVRKGTDIITEGRPLIFKLIEKTVNQKQSHAHAEQH